MKLSSTLIQTIAIGIAAGVLTSSCQQNDVNSGLTKNTKKEKKEKSDKQPCPGCGMG